MLQMESVTKQYTRRGNTIKALNDVSLEIDRGEFAAIIGPSGSGKSSFLLVLGGMLSPDRGRVFVEGESVYEQGSEARARLRKKMIGFVFQTFNLVPYLTAQENVQVPLFLAGLAETDQAARAQQLLERVGLADRMQHKPSELSVGQQQRVALARMLANDPPVIMADEPTGNLDPATAQSVLDFFQELNEEGRTIVMVTHDTRAAARCKKVLRLVSGVVCESGPEMTTVSAATRAVAN